MNKEKAVYQVQNFRSAKLIEVLAVVCGEGDGKETAYREVTYYLDTDGNLLARSDPWEER